MRKQFLAITVLLFVSLTSFAQISVRPYYQVDLSSAFNKAEFTLETPKLGYTIGADVNYQIAPNFDIKTGLMFQKMGNKTELAYLSTPDGFVNRQFDLTYNYVSIPLQIQYNLNQDSRFVPYLAVGAALNMNTTNYVKTSYYDLNEELISSTVLELLGNNGGSIRKFNVSAKVDLGFNYKMTDNLSLNMSISTNIFLLSTNNDFISDNRHFNTGIGIGISYKF